MTHRIKCRGVLGGEVGLNRADRFIVHYYETANLGVSRELTWNGLSYRFADRIWRDPCYLPIAWLALEAAHGTDDYVDALAHAAAVIDGHPTEIECPACDGEGLRHSWASWRCQDCYARGKIPGPPDMLSPALMLCDWMEVRESDWGIGLRHQGVPEILGPLHAWCRHLIETRCLTCGGRRDGEDDLRIGGAVLGPRKIVASKHDWPDLSRTCCPDCKHPKHPTPPGLEIPRIVRM